MLLLSANDMPPHKAYPIALAGFPPPFSRDIYVADVNLLSPSSWS